MIDIHNLKRYTINSIDIIGSVKCRMNKFKLKGRQFNDVSRIKFILVLLVFVVTLTFSIPSLARYKNYVNLEAMFNEVQTWDGSIAESFSVGAGTQEDPYVIMDAAEFAYFATNVDETGYAGTYFKLGNNIVLNNGVFGYDEEHITYELNDTLFYLEEYSGNAYGNSELSGNIISNVNLFEQIDNFRGYFDGDYYTIYGLYLTKETDELALFKNLSGKVENVYFKNGFIYGGSSTAMLANNVSYGEINNVSTDGIVVGRGDTLYKNVVVALDDVLETKELNMELIRDLNVVKPFEGTFKSIVLSGNYECLECDIDIFINEQSFSNGNFEISLDTTNTIAQLKVSGEDSANISLTNLKVTYTYNYPISSGFVANSNDSNFNNVINKAVVYGKNVAGLVGIGSNLSVSNGYNLGNLKGNYVSGIVNRIVNNDSMAIDKVYNNGQLVGDDTNLVGDILNSGTVLISNCFNAKESSSTFGNVSGVVQVTNLYDVNSTSTKSGNLTGLVNVVSRDNINKQLLVESMGYGEYVDNQDIIGNPGNVWVYEYEDMPVLYVDELNNPVASLNLGVYSWNDLGYDLNEYKFTESKAFNVTVLDDFTDIKEVYYYLHEGNTPLNKSELVNITDWTLYDDIVSLDMEGYYIVYVKVVDQDNHNFYINSDVVLFDLYGPDIKLTLGDEVWNSYDENLESLYIADKTNVNVDVTDKYSEVENSEYFVSKVFIDQEELDGFDGWTKLENEIVIDTMGTNVVYVRSVDSNGHINIVNSDYIIFGGYSSDLSVGSHTFNSVDEANITNKSSVVYKFTYDENIPYTDGYNTKLVLSNKLPKNTLITFVDHKLNEVYSYEVNADELDISLNKFVKVGNTNNVLFDDIAYLVTDKKEVSVIFDFSNATIEDNFGFNAYLELRDNLGNVVLSTLNDTIKNTNIYKGLNSELSIVNKSVIYGINYDSDTKNMIEFEYSFNNLVSNNVVINDTYYEYLKTGIAIKLINAEGNTIDKKYLKNMEFIVDGVNYFADSDGIVRINMSNDISKVIGQLTVVTHENDFDLSEGDYSLVIEPYVSYDGKYSDNFAISNISIPVVSDYQDILDFEFNIEMNDESKILVKDSGTVRIPVDIISNNDFENPSVRVSLYKKVNLSAYDQNYNLIDLDDYLVEELEVATDYSYIISDGHLELNLDLTNMDKTGYELRFELFDGDRRIDIIKKKFIVK